MTTHTGLAKEKRCVCELVLKTARDGACLTSKGSLFHIFIFHVRLMQQQFIFVSYLNRKKDLTTVLTCWSSFRLGSIFTPKLVKLMLFPHIIWEGNKQMDTVSDQ